MRCEASATAPLSCAQRADTSADDNDEPLEDAKDVAVPEEDGTDHVPRRSHDRRRDHRAGPDPRSQDGSCCPSGERVDRERDQACPSGRRVDVGLRRDHGSDDAGGTDWPAIGVPRRACNHERCKDCNRLGHLNRLSSRCPRHGRADGEPLETDADLSRQREAQQAEADAYSSRRCAARQTGFHAPRGPSCPHECSPRRAPSSFWTRPSRRSPCESPAQPPLPAESNRQSAVANEMLG